MSSLALHRRDSVLYLAGSFTFNLKKNQFPECAHIAIRALKHSLGYFLPLIILRFEALPAF